MQRLIISEIPSDFNPGKDILLGPFCLVGHEKKFSEWESYIIEPDPFETVAEKKNAVDFAALYANSLLPFMKDELNKLNNIDESLEFWRMIVFPWLLLHVTSLWEKYQRIKSIISKYNEIQLEVKIINSDPKWSFQNTLDYHYNGLLNLHFSEWLLSRLIEDNKPPNWSLVYEDKKPTKKPLPEQSWKRKLYDNLFMRLRCKGVIGINPLESIVLSLLLEFKKEHKVPERNTTVTPKQHFGNSDKINSKLFKYVLLGMPKSFKNTCLQDKPKSIHQKGRIRIVGAFDLHFNEKHMKFLADCKTRGGE